MAFFLHLKSLYLSKLIHSRFSPNRVTYTGTAIPRCALVIAQSWNIPSLTASAGSHSRKMLSAEIPALFYLITSGCCTSRHNPLLHTFTGSNVIHCRYLFARNGIMPPLPQCKSIRIKAKIKSGVCVSYEVVGSHDFFQVCKYLNR